VETSEFDFQGFVLFPSVFFFPLGMMALRKDIGGAGVCSKNHLNVTIKHTLWTLKHKSLVPKEFKAF
jgi:hypothetical protein